MGPNHEKLRELTRSALFCVFIIAGAWIRIPFLFGVPLTFQVPAVQMAALLLKPPYGIFCILLYLTLGILGLPVFAAGASGPGYFLEKTGGFLLGFLIQAMILQIFQRFFLAGSFRIFLSIFISTLIVFACGIPFAAKVANIGTYQMFVGMLPFYPAAGVKIFITFYLVQAIRRRI